MSMLAYAEAHPIQIGAGVFAVGLLGYLVLHASKPTTTVVQAPASIGYNAQAVAANQQIQALQIAGQVRAAGYNTALKAAMDKNATQLQIANLARQSNQDNITATNALALTQIGGAQGLRQIDASVANHKTDTQLSALQVQAASAAAHDATMLTASQDSNSTALQVANLQASVAVQKATLDHFNVIENKDVLIKQAQYGAEAAVGKATAAVNLHQQDILAQEYMAGLNSTTQIQVAGYRASAANSASGGSTDNTGQYIASAAMLALMFL